MRPLLLALLLAAPTLAQDEGHAEGWYAPVCRGRPYEAWRVDLDAADPDRRVDALEALGDLRAYWGAQAIAARLRDEEARVRWTALGVLETLGPAGADALGAALLSSERADVRVGLLRWLERARALPALPPGAAARVLRDLEAEDEGLAATALRVAPRLAAAGLLEAGRVVALLRPRLLSGGTRAHAAEGLARVGTAEAVQVLIDALLGGDAEARERAAASLAGVETELARAGLIQALDRGGPQRLAAALALAGGQFEQARVADALVERLLGDAPPEVASIDLVNALSSLRPETLRAAAGDRVGQVAERLGRLLDDDLLREGVVVALSSLGPAAAPAVPALAALLDRPPAGDDDPAQAVYARLTLLEALAAIGPAAGPEAVAAVLRRLDADAAGDSLEATTAVWTLARLGAAETEPRAVAAWRRAPSFAVARALAFVGPPEGHPLLRTALDGPDGPARTCAVVGLASVGRGATPRLLAVLGELLGHDAEDRRLLALDCCRALGPAARPLGPAIRSVAHGADPDSPERGAAERALKAVEATR